MKYEVMQEQLVKGLGLVSRAVASRPQLPVLANVLIEAKKDGLVLSATDLEIGITTRVPAKVSVEGRVSVPARMVVDYVSSLSPGKIECFLEKEALVLVARGFRGKVQTIAAEEFPSLPAMGEGPVAFIKHEDYVKGVESVSYAAAKDALRPVLTGVLLEWKKGRVKMVATDGFRLSVRELPATGEGWTKPLLVPSRAVMEVLKFEEEGELEMILYEKSSQVAFRRGGDVIVSQLLSGNYPEYGKIIPSEWESEVKMKREELLIALRSVHIFARENSNVTRWRVAGEGVELSSQSPEKGEAKAEVAGELVGEGGEIAFNAKFVLDYLQSSSAEMVSLSMSGALAPGAFRESENKEYLYIVMPINA